MNILAVSGDFSIGDMCDYFVREGHQVKVYLDDTYYKRSLEGRFTYVENWQKELSWVGRDGLIIFDTTGFGEIQDELRQAGYSVIGGSAKADRCEDDREYGQKVLSEAGLTILPTHHFQTSIDAIDFIRNNPKKWVLKHNGHVAMTATLVGESKDGSDVVTVLSKMEARNDSGIVLQERVHGVEIGIARYFNGTDWVGPIEYNVEHKRLEDGDRGPNTWEMGTLMWFDGNESNRLYAETLKRLASFLVEAGFRGDVDINCIVNERGVFPLEWTTRFGFPALQLQRVLATSNFTDFLCGVARGEKCDFEYTQGFGIILLIAVPPFPYETPQNGEASPQGTPIKFSESLTHEEKSRIHFEDVYQDACGEQRISSGNGFVMHVSGKGESINQARSHAYSLARKIVLPKMFFRTDIGVSFFEKYETQLKDWGWL